MPAAMIWTTLNPGSVTAWSELTKVIAEADHTDERYPPEDLLEELSEPGVDPELDTVAVWDGTQLVAFGQLRVREGLNVGRVRAYLGGGVHPAHRGQGIGRRILDQLEDRARELARLRHPGIDVILGASGGLDGDPLRPLLEHRGYQVVRYFHQMARALPGERLAQPEVVVDRYEASVADALRQAHNDAFATHFGSVPLSESEWRSDLASRAFRPNCSFVARDAGGEVQGYVMSYSHVEGELYIGRVGTIQAARGRGLARACLLAALHAGAEAGYVRALLDVDSMNPTGAGALYESVGFRRSKTFAVYDKVVPALTS